ncbi:MAG: carbohydrate ABC transporter permease [Alphaproteobacteria bacterium]
MRTSLTTVVALAVVVVFVMPLLWLVAATFRQAADRVRVRGLGIPWLDFDPQIDAWVDQLSTPLIRDALWDSAVIAVSAMALALVLAVPAAWSLARMARRGGKVRSDIVTGLLLTARLVPPIMLVVPLYLLMDWVDLIDTKLALILVNASLVLPFIIVIMRQTFLDLPVELEEAAALDGAPGWVILLHIILPVSTPALAAGALISLAYVWNDYLFALSFFRLEMRTMPMLITAGGGGADMMVRTTIAILLPAVVALLAQRYIVRGLTFGALGK